jgi:hypothetical protein
MATPSVSAMSDTLIFRCEGTDLSVDLSAGRGTETLRQVLEWLPAQITIHCAKIAGCHIYWPSPVLARLEKGRDIHTLAPGALLYYPDRQYLEIIYDELQAETAAVTHLGQLTGGVEWLRDFATRQRKQAGTEIFTAELIVPGGPRKRAAISFGQDTAWDRIREARQAVWAKQPDEITAMLARQGHNIPLGPMATADGYFRTVQESLWQLWNDPGRFSNEARRAAAINAIELGISRIGHYCHLTQSQAVLEDALAVIDSADVPFQDLLSELIIYCSRMSNWVDLHIPWYPANELTKRCLGRND